MNIFLLLFTIYFYLSQEEYIKQCFGILGVGKELSIKWNNKFLFIPDSLKIKAMIKETTTDSRENIHESTMLITKLEKTKCDSNLLIPDFMGDKTLLIHIQVGILFMDYEIEHFECYLRKGFKSHRYSEYEGFNNLLKITFGFSQKVKTFENYISNDIFWITRASFTYSRNNLCMRIMNFESKYTFQTDYVISNNERIINKFNILRVISYGDEEMNQLVSRVEYITEINECSERVTYPPLNMLVDHSIKAIEIHLIPQGKSESLYKMKLVRKENEFVSVTSTGYYSKLFNVKVKEESVEKAVQNLKESLLLYDQKKTKQNCIIDAKEIENDVIMYSGTPYTAYGRVKLWNDYRTAGHYRNIGKEELRKCPE